MGRRGIVAGMVWLALAGASMPGWADENEAAARKELEEARESVAKWVGAQQLLLKERKDWQQGKDLLTSRIELVGGEIAQIEETMAETRKAIREATTRRDEVEDKKELFVMRAAVLETTATALEERVQALKSRLPDPLQQKLSPLYDRMQVQGAAKKISLAERFQNVLGILNEINKANAEITLASEVRSLGDGKPAEVRTVYIGLGQAYYLSAGGEAGVGRPGDGGWTFTPDNQLRESVMQVIEVMQSTSTPRFVPMPVRIN